MRVYLATNKKILITRKKIKAGAAYLVGPTLNKQRAAGSPYSGGMDEAWERQPCPMLMKGKGREDGNLTPADLRPHEVHGILGN